MTLNKTAIDDAWRLVALTPAGRTCRAHLAGMLMAGPTPGQPSGAVHEEVGRLNLARELLSLMDVSEANALSDPVYSARGVPGNPAGRGSRRRVSPDDSRR